MKLPSPNNQRASGVQAEGLFWAARIMGLGLELCGMIVLGWALDRALGTAPWLAMAGTVLGLIVSFAHLVAIAKTVTKRSPPHFSSTIKRPTPPDPESGDDAED